MDKMIGMMLDGRYEILEVVGRGGMSVVYRAKCHRLNRMVAVKVLKDEFLGDDEFKNRFQDESLSVAMLSHPNIVAVYDVSRSNDIEYIVMELIDGITLKEYLSKKGPMQWQEIVFLTTQIAKALEHAHQRGVIHRDIKPQNIMILRDGTVKVADFGIAHQVTKQTTYSKGEALGSVHYVSPEQAKGSRVDNRTDIYSLGVVMYEMLTGRLPFDGTSPVAVAIQHISAVPLNPRDYIPSIPEAIEAVTMKAMSANLSTRYANADELIRDLDKIRNDPHVKIPITPMEPVDSTPQNGATQKINYQSEIEQIGKKNREKTREGQGASAGKRRIREDDEPEEKRSNVNVSLIVNVVAILFFVFGAFYFVINVINPFASGPDESDIIVPNLVGELFDQIEGNPKYEGMIIKEQEKVYHDTIAAGVIIEQKPEAERKMSEGDTITVVVSRGQRTTAMPDLIGKEYRQAKVELERMGISTREEWSFSDTVGQNNIISTTPKAGEDISENMTVVFEVSKGKELKEVVVPNIVGKTEAEAVELIKGAGLKPGENTKVESAKPDGQVIFQNIPAGASVMGETVVDFQTSRYVAPKKVVRKIDVNLIISQDPIDVEVYVNDVRQYIGTHSSGEEKVAVPVNGYSGTNRVKIVQNGKTTSDEDVLF